MAVAGAAFDKRQLSRTLLTFIPSTKLPVLHTRRTERIWGKINEYSDDDGPLLRRKTLIIVGESISREL